MMLKSSLFRKRSRLLTVSLIAIFTFQLISIRFALASPSTVEHQRQSSAPVIVSTPVTEATVGGSYQYKVVTEGSPDPIFQLSAAPVGMSIGVTSGEINWVPDAAGSFDVVVLATNSNGTTSQSFRVRVVKPTNLSYCPANLIAYWQQEEISGSQVFSDIFGSHHATCDSEYCPKVASGQVGEAQYFDGNSRVSVSETQVFDWGHTDSFSIELWVNTKQLCTSNAVFAGRYRGGSASWWMGCGRGGKAQFMLRDSDDNSYSLASQTNVNDGDWHHVVVGRDFQKSENYLYVDSQLEATIPTTYTGSFANSDSLRIGYYDNNYFFVGMLDEIAIYKRMLNADEILQHYQNGTVGLGYCTLSDVAAPVITSSPIQHSVVNETYRYDVDATGNPAPKYELLTSPTGMTINATTGVIQWVAESVGVVDVTVQASNVGGDITQSFSISVTEQAVAPQITSSPVVTGTVGQEYRYNVTVTGNPAPSIQLIGTQPEGMIVNAATKSIRWIPGEAGSYPVTVRAINSAGSVDQNFVVTVTVPLRAPTITSTPITLTTAKEPYIYEVKATGYPTPTFDLVDEPSGMTINADTGVIQWMPEVAGSYNIQIEAKNSAGVINQDYTLLVEDYTWLPTISRN